MNLIDFLYKKEKNDKAKKAKTVIENDIEYIYIKNKKSKYIKISIRNANKVRISVPINCPYRLAKDFVEQKKDWIYEHLERLELNKIDENYRTKTDNLLISTGFVEKPLIKKSGNIIQFIYPIGGDFYSNEVQRELKKALKKAIEIEAGEYLPKRLDELSKKFNFKYKKLALKNHKTRWGSCSFANNINLNINLMTLSSDLIDYVLIHELCHTVEKNHKEGFWNLLETCLPNAKNLRKELKTKTFTV